MVKTHLGYVALIAVLLVFGYVWLSEHDARVIADNTIKTLQTQIKATDAQAATQVKVITKIVHDAGTPAKVIAAVPQLTDAPLNTRVAVDNPSQVSVEAAPFVILLGQAKQDAINLAACKSDLKSESDMVVALKKKPKFFKRVLGVAKAVGVGVGIGLLISGHL